MRLNKLGRYETIHATQKGGQISVLSLKSSLPGFPNGDILQTDALTQSRYRIFPLPQGSLLLTHSPPSLLCPQLLATTDVFRSYSFMASRILPKQNHRVFNHLRMTSFTLEIHQSCYIFQQINMHELIAYSFLLPSSTPCLGSNKVCFNIYPLKNLSVVFSLRLL